MSDENDLSNDDSPLRSFSAVLSGWARRVGQLVADVSGKTTVPEPLREPIATARALRLTGDRETPQATVSDLWVIEHDGLPADYLSRYLDGIKKTTRADVLRDAKRFMARDKLVIVVVGEAEKIKEDLERIAPVTVIAAAPDSVTKPPADGE